MAITFQSVAAPDFTNVNALLKFQDEQQKAAFTTAKETFDAAVLGARNKIHSKMQSAIDLYSYDELNDPKTRGDIMASMAALAEPYGDNYDPLLMNKYLDERLDTTLKRDNAETTYLTAEESRKQAQKDNFVKNNENLVNELTDVAYSFDNQYADAETDADKQLIASLRQQAEFDVFKKHGIEPNEVDLQRANAKNFRLQQAQWRDYLTDESIIAKTELDKTRASSILTNTGVNVANALKNTGATEQDKGNKAYNDAAGTTGVNVVDQNGNINYDLLHTNIQNELSTTLAQRFEHNNYNQFKVDRIAKDIKSGAFTENSNTQLEKLYSWLERSGKPLTDNEKQEIYTAVLNKQIHLSDYLHKDWILGSNQYPLIEQNVINWVDWYRQHRAPELRNQMRKEIFQKHLTVLNNAGKSKEEVLHGLNITSKDHEDYWILPLHYKQMIDPKAKESDGMPKFNSFSNLVEAKAAKQENSKSQKPSEVKRNSSSPTVYELRNPK